MPENPLTVIEMARMGGLTRTRKFSPEARKAASRKAYLAGAVNSIARYPDQLTDEQRDKLFEALYGPGAA